MNPSGRSASHRSQLAALAVEAMRSHGLDPGFPPDVLAETAALREAPATTGEGLRDLRALPWCSIDNDDSRDLDQLSVADRLPGGDVKILVAIADVDATVAKGSAVDRHAAVNTTSVYTPAVLFPMLPEKLSTDLTSLAPHEDRLSIVVEFIAAADGSIRSSEIYRAHVRNHAKLAYRSVDAWLSNGGLLPPAAAQVPGMSQLLRLQDQVAQTLNARRQDHGALDFETRDVHEEFEGDTVRQIRSDPPNRAKMLIENLMIAANGVTARFLESNNMPSLRRVVRRPLRWDRIVTIAADLGTELPLEPDSQALAQFLAARKKADPEGFLDLSHTLIKLIGSGEYAVHRPGADPPGHFGLAVKDYAHSTAPNRRFPDLITQRLLKATLSERPSPYGVSELELLARRCTEQEDRATKVERQVRKSAAALVVVSRLGDRFEGIVTGASQKGTFVRVTAPPIEGKVVSGERGLDVGDRVTVRLVRADVERGFIDFAAVR
jgi:VacB/RNase II family 3'-5' exoribonuclease